MFRSYDIIVQCCNTASKAWTISVKLNFVWAVLHQFYDILICSIVDKLLRPSSVPCYVAIYIILLPWHFIP